MPPWNNCSCNTLYTDAWGNPINGAGSGADGTQQAQPSPCTPNYGLLALAGFAALLGVMMAHGGKA